MGILVAFRFLFFSALQEAPEVERLLCALLIQVPQQLYFDVRTAYLEKREQVAQKQSVQTGRGTLDSQPQQQSLALLSRLMTVFRTSFTPQCMALDHLAGESHCCVCGRPFAWPQPATAVCGEGRTEARFPVGV